ncbi:CapA family protein [Silicimonas algicola]|nr:CapA family protein [Silicimonas algicola]
MRLTPDDGETISLHFVGDTMFGRRFYDANGDGELSDGLLRPGAGAEEHAALLEAVAPLLAGADLTALNLETPLLEDPYFPPAGPRPERFHPMKVYAFGSDTAAAKGLRLAGVDVVDLGNNHLFDALEEGIASTIRALEEAGFSGPTAGHFGAGPDVATAWAPALVEVPTSSGGAVKLAFIGCTTILGLDHEVSYVADEGKGGAAACDPGLIRQAVLAARQESDAVVVMIHGGFEYEASPSASVLANTEAALGAGATLVMNHHPHVVGGFRHVEVEGQDSLVAWTLGNFLFDQDRRETFETYLVAVHLRRGEIVRAYAEALMIERYTPKGLVGDLARHVARGAAGREPGRFVMENGAMEVDLAGAARRIESMLPAVGSDGAGSIYRVPPEWFVRGLRAAPGSASRLGRDVLWTGAFEDDLVGAVFPDGAPLWSIEGGGKVAGADFAQEGRVGVRLWRSALSPEPVSVTHIRRLAVEGGSDLTVTGMLRSTFGADVALGAAFFPRTEGDPLNYGSRPEFQSEAAEPMADPAESGWAEVPLETTGGEWRPFRLDLRAPEGAGLLQVRVRLTPPAEGTATADFDAIRVIRWAPPGTEPSPRHEFLLVHDETVVTLARDVLPGAEAWTGDPGLVRLWPADLFSSKAVPRPALLPEPLASPTRARR